MDGDGSASSTVWAFAPPPFFPSLLPPASGAGPFFFSFFSFCLPAEGAGADVDGSSALGVTVLFALLSTGALGAFSFFLEGSAFLSNLGALSRSNDICLKASFNDSADARTAAPDWM